MTTKELARRYRKIDYDGRGNLITNENQILSELNALLRDELIKFKKWNVNTNPSKVLDTLKPEEIIDEYLKS